ncbi:MAG: hypothetical protein GY854_15675 [Deltaproteobacteria bacterium]|nr:hypothetical protein [Deltaproteobacteria bacterium]
MEAVLRSSMITSIRAAFVVALAPIFLCCSDDAQMCDPGDTESCDCGNGTGGTKRCKDSGKDWSSCDCVDNENDVVSGSLPIEGSACAVADTLVCGKDLEEVSDALALYCDNGIYTRVFECPEGKDCVNVNGYAAVSCADDEGSIQLAVTDAPCPNEGSAACDFKQTTVLLCLEEHWYEAIHCAPSECIIKTKDSGEKAISCANGGYSIGDWCTFEGQGLVCSTDAAGLLECVDGKTVLSIACEAPELCTRTTDQDGNLLIGCE